MEVKRYQIQTKLYQFEDLLVIWGPIRLTLRQCFVLILGGCGSIDLWGVLDGLAGIGNTGLVIRIALTSFPTLLAMGVAAVRVADRYAEGWAIVVLHYAMHTSIYIWLPQGTLRTPKPQAAGNPRQTDDDTSRSHKRG